MNEARILRSQNCSPNCSLLVARCSFPHARSRGFSFTEILFAVIVLGIGFIMIAAIFPVAIQQGKLTAEEGTATAVAREALGELQQIGANSDATPNNTSSVTYPTAGITGGPLFPATGIANSPPPYFGAVFSMRDPQPASYNSLNTPLVGPTTANPLITVTAGPTYQLWNQLKMRLVVPTDQRYAFVGLYRRNGDPNDRRTWSPYAQCWFIPVTARARSVFSPGSPTSPGVDVADSANINLQARLVKVSIDIASPSTYSNTAQNSYVLYNWSGTAVPSSAYTPSSLYENCYVIIADDQINTPAAGAVYTGSSVNRGRMNGHIYHVGLRRPDLDRSSGGNSVTAYDLSPNGNFTPEPDYAGILSTTEGIYTIGVASSTSASGTIVGSGPSSPLAGGGPADNASGPADAYVISLDDSTGTPTGISQDISAFTTFIKVN